MAFAVTLKLDFFFEFLAIKKRLGYCNKLILKFKLTLEERKNNSVSEKNNVSENNHVYLY